MGAVIGAVAASNITSDHNSSWDRTMRRMEQNDRVVRDHRRKSDEDFIRGLSSESWIVSRDGTNGITTITNLSSRKSYTFF